MSNAGWEEKNMPKTYNKGKYSRFCFLTSYPILTLSVRYPFSLVQTFSFSFFSFGRLAYHLHRDNASHERSLASGFRLVRQQCSIGLDRKNEVGYPTPKPHKLIPINLPSVTMRSALLWSQGWHHLSSKKDRLLL